MRELIYVIDSGLLIEGGTTLATGYSGRAGKWRNNPAFTGLINSGPIPAGRYRLGRYYTSKRVGPYAIPLTPVGHNALGRSALLIHGDNRTRDASRGCIILRPDVRIPLARYEDSTGDPVYLTVVASWQEPD